MPSQPHTPPRPATVLVADDSATARAVVRVELEHAGYRVVEACDGAQAVRAVHDQDVDVVVLDVEMPELDGWQVLDRLEQDETTAALPVVFLTALTATDDLVRALHRGAHDFVRKPPEPAELLARVSSAARVKELQDALRARAAELEEQGRTDVLTGLHNRRHADEHLRATVSRARRHGETVVAVLLDVDHFKRGQRRARPRGRRQGPSRGGQGAARDGARGGRRRAVGR